MIGSDTRRKGPLLLLLLLLPVSGCALPPPDQPAYYSRMGRFMGLVARCGCSDVSADRMLAEYGKVVAGRYSEPEVAGMKGYVQLAVSENAENLMQICADVCSQSCMVQSVVEPLGGRRVAEHACLVNERDLRVMDGARVMCDGASHP